MLYRKRLPNLACTGRSAAGHPPTIKGSRYSAKTPLVSSTPMFCNCLIRDGVRQQALIYSNHATTSPYLGRERTSVARNAWRSGVFHPRTDPAALAGSVVSGSSTSAKPQVLGEKIIGASNRRI